MLLFLQSLSVKNELKFSGWHFETCFFRFDVGEMLSDLRILPDSHTLHVHRSEKILFRSLMAAIRWKNSDKWANFCLNFVSGSSSARIHCKNILVTPYTRCQNPKFES